MYRALIDETEMIWGMADHDRYESKQDGYTHTSIMVSFSLYFTSVLLSAVDAVVIAAEIGLVEQDKVGKRRKLDEIEARRPD